MLSGSKKNENSMMGMVCCGMTFILFAFILAFQIEYIANQRGNTVYSVVKEDWISEDYEFASEDGFNFAISLVDPNQPAFIDTRYVTL